MEQDTSPGRGAEVTCISDIVLPVEVVSLTHLRTRSGAPVRVRCEGLDEVVISEIFKALGGDHVPGVPTGASEDPETALDQLRQLNIVAPALIEAGTALQDASGADVRPAFYFGPVRPHPLSIPGRLLRQEDRVALCSTIMRLGGYLGGAAGAGFHGGDGGGSGDGVGVVEAGGGAGDAAVRGDGPADRSVDADSGPGPGPVASGEAELS
jgi:hypothetical protein